MGSLPSPSPAQVSALADRIAARFTDRPVENELSRKLQQPPRTSGLASTAAFHRQLDLLEDLNTLYEPLREAPPQPFTLLRDYFDDDVPVVHVSGVNASSERARALRLHFLRRCGVRRIYPYGRKPEGRPGTEVFVYFGPETASEAAALRAESLGHDVSSAAGASAGGAGAAATQVGSAGASAERNNACTTMAYPAPDPGAAAAAAAATSDAECQLFEAADMDWAWQSDGTSLDPGCLRASWTTASSLPSLPLRAVVWGENGCVLAAPATLPSPLAAVGATPVPATARGTHAKRRCAAMTPSSSSASSAASGQQARSARVLQDNPPSRKRAALPSAVGTRWASHTHGADTNGIAPSPLQRHHHHRRHRHLDGDADDDSDDFYEPDNRAAAASVSAAAPANETFGLFDPDVDHFVRACAGCGAGIHNTCSAFNSASSTIENTSNAVLRDMWLVGEFPARHPVRPAMLLER